MDRVADLKKYVAYRRAELQAQRDRLNSQVLQGITTGSAIEFGQRANVIGLVLDELESFFDWEGRGEPKYVPPLTAEERHFWAKAKSRGMEIPEEIEAQLRE